MRKTKSACWVLTALVLAGLLAATAATAQKDDQAEVMLQAAMHKQLVEGDLEGAIQEYKKIVADFSGDHAVAARALVKMGECYEKLGKSEAQKAFERVLKDYPEQIAEANEARTHLAALAHGGAPGGEMVTRRVWAGPFVDILGKPSPDGHYIAITDWLTGNLAIRETATGAIRRLTDNGNWRGWAEFAVPSPDGKQIAYAWFNENAQFDLRVFSLDASSARVVYANDQVSYALPVAWTPDGRSIVTGLARTDQTHQIVFVSVADGSTRVLKTFHDWRNPQSGSLSPDGRYVVYDLPRKEDSPERDIFILSADGKVDAPLVEHPADDMQPVWTPDGKQVIFASDRTGRLGIWAIPVADGKAQGPPQLVRADVPPLRAMGLTRDGAFYYGVWTGMTDVYLAALDPQTGAVLSPPTPLTQRFVGSNWSPDWSPDGKFFVYVSERGTLPHSPARKIIVRSLATGEEREIAVKLAKLGRRLRWSPDGRWFLTHAQDARGQAGFFKVNAETGEATLVLREEPPGEIQSHTWSPDGKTIFYLRLAPVAGKPANRLRTHNVETGEDREVCGIHINNFAVSPDGRWVVTNFSLEKERRLVTIPVLGGEPRVLMTLQETEDIPPFSSMAWTPDGKYILFTKAQREGLQGPFELWRIAAEGGTPQKLGITMDQLRDLRIRPDGQRIVFSAGQNKQEVWVMENFLPALKAAK